MVGVLNVVTLPAGLVFWLVIHRWARVWRKRGPACTYSIVLPIVAAVGVVCFKFRESMLGADLGTSWQLIAIAAVLYWVSMFEIRYWKQLNVTILVGIPEVTRYESSQGTLLTDGAYGMVRHPRYLSAGIGIVGNVLLSNHSGLYVLVLLLYPAGFLMLMYEERDLVDRFGERYRQYQREVPQILPRLKHARRE